MVDTRLFFCPIDGLFFRFVLYPAEQFVWFITMLNSSFIKKYLIDFFYLLYFISFIYLTDPV